MTNTFDLALMSVSALNGHTSSKSSTEKTAQFPPITAEKEVLFQRSGLDSWTSSEQHVQHVPL